MSESWQACKLLLITTSIYTHSTHYNILITLWARSSFQGLLAMRIKDQRFLLVDGNTQFWVWTCFKIIWTQITYSHYIMTCVSYGNCFQPITRDCLKALDHQKTFVHSNLMSCEIHCLCLRLSRLPLVPTKIASQLLVDDHKTRHKQSEFSRPISHNIVRSLETQWGLCWLTIGYQIVWYVFDLCSCY